MLMLISRAHLYVFFYIHQYSRFFDDAHNMSVLLSDVKCNTHSRQFQFRVMKMTTDFATEV